MTRTAMFVPVFCTILSQEELYRPPTILCEHRRDKLLGLRLHLCCSGLKNHQGAQNARYFDRPQAT